MDFSTLQDARLLAWAEERLKEKFDPVKCRWVAGLVAGQIACVVVFSHFSSTNCLLSIATDGSRRWASRSLFRFVFGTVFKQWKLRRATFVVSERNEASLAMLRKRGHFSIGAKEEGRMRDLFPDSSAGIVFGLTKEECKWI
jgi:hypothetical protein